MTELSRRAVRFVISGGVSTGVAYFSLIALLPYVNFAIAATASWSLSLLCGFLLNRRFTYRIVGGEQRARDFGKFTLGAGLQYAVAMTGYWLLLEKLKLNPSLAFLLNLIVTTAFSFAFHSLVTFRRAVASPVRPSAQNAGSS